jgi:pimeloyl-ACP methyl ester carboxylesterase
MEKTIVLLHGFGEDHHIFDKQIQVLSAKYNVFAPDLPGSGINTNHQWEKGSATIEWMAIWVNQVLSRRGIKSCILLGHSMGGYIALAFAEKFPEMLDGFGLIHSTAFEDSAAKKEIRRKAISFINEKGTYPFLKAAIPGLFGSDFKNKNEEVINRLIERSRDFTIESLTFYYRAMMERPDRSIQLKKAKVPVLILAGAHDIAAPLVDLAIQAAMPSVCHFYILQNTGHMGMLEESENISTILLNFVDAV